MGANAVLRTARRSAKSGEPFSYSSWWVGGGEPNNAGGVEHFVEMEVGKRGAFEHEALMRRIARDQSGEIGDVAERASGSNARPGLRAQTIDQMQAETNH